MMVGVGGVQTETVGQVMFRLYVAGATTRSARAILVVREVCAAAGQGCCVVEIVDVYQQPERAREDRIIATPTLIRLHPRPCKRWIGAAIDADRLQLLHFPPAEVPGATSDATANQDAAFGPT